MCIHTYVHTVLRYPEINIFVIEMLLDKHNLHMTDLYILQAVVFKRKGIQSCGLHQLYAVYIN